MRISEAIKQLEEIKKEKGDLNLKNETLIDIALIAVQETGDDFATVYTY